MITSTSACAPDAGLPARFSRGGHQSRCGADSRAAPNANSYSLQWTELAEAWQAAKPQVQAWTSDAVTGERWAGDGVMTNDSHCNQWYGLVGSSQKQATGQLHIESDEIRFDTSNVGSGGALDRIVTKAFSIEALLDSPAVANAARAWLESQGLKEDKTRVKAFDLVLDPNALRNCQANTGPVYRIEFSHPSGSLCLQAGDGTVTHSSFR